MGNPQLPSNEDLLAQIRFDPDQGTIWLSEQRVMLNHAGVWGALRDELVETMGMQRARALLMRYGYQTGLRDAELARKLRPDLPVEQAFMVGPQLHSIRGLVHVTPLELEFDLAKGSYFGRFEWRNSFEAQVYLQHHDTSKEPVCWSQLGYASGYTTYFMGRSIIYKEVACAGCGSTHCEIVGKPAEEWEDHAETQRLLMRDSMAEELFALQSQLSELREAVRASEQDTPANSVGRSRAFREASQLIRRAAASKANVLLLGETGVGKEVFARALHAGSPRAEQPFVAVNCASIPPDLIEAELFGVEKGAYTGATVSRPGKFERANRGTIFLDEVVELSARAQASLLRVLQEGELERVGGTHSQKIDVRIVAATNEDLQQAVANGKFRMDLYYRLNVYPVHIPPLRERTDDIPLLTEHFVGKYNAVYGKRILGVSDKALQALMHYAWPGNIRELENMMERGVILTDSNQMIDVHTLFPTLAEAGGMKAIAPSGHLHTPPAPGAPSSPDTLCEQLLNNEFKLDQFEARLIHTAMARAAGNVTQAARLLGITRPQLAYRLDKLKLPK
ncbi:sigma-54-dependent Fis family transcriptional regulator [Massilia litorea]|uniref:Sigma 54-interacting transcriptional regulator n=1 Tax=Massilia litorea TaxID=2769491 RepID=A0A7L9U0R2_9BURK|nr:sigma-54-dependent Fis family transcriptional regulator [Massilia litorea]QOL48487.1 sigma 54-interacting transcriptional regulator [Massilia litorea]